MFTSTSTEKRYDLKQTLYENLRKTWAEHSFDLAA